MLDFLAQATIEDVAEKQVARKGGPRKEWNPQTGLTIRIWKDGSVFPSQELVNKFFLEYAGKEVEHGYGFDVVDTELYPAFKSPKRILLISAVKKSSPKVDLFGSTSYDDKGQPKASVMDQGAVTFGKDDLIPAIEEIYGITFARPAKDSQPAVEGVEYVDMTFATNPATGQPWTTPKEVTYLPKKVSRGEAKGTVTTIRREKPEFYAFVPASWISQPDRSAAELSEPQANMPSAPVSEVSAEVAESPFRS